MMPTVLIRPWPGNQAALSIRWPDGVAVNVPYKTQKQKAAIAAFYKVSALLDQTVGSL